MCGIKNEEEREEEEGRERGEGGAGEGEGRWWEKEGNDDEIKRTSLFVLLRGVICGDIKLDVIQRDAILRKTRDACHMSRVLWLDLFDDWV